MNGYPEDTIKQALSPTQRGTVESEAPQKTMSLPYIPGISEKKGRICKDYNIRTVYHSSDTLGKRLTSVKPKLSMWQRKNVIYQIPCECGESYIGETLRPLEKRIAEHKKCCSEGDNKSGVAEHMWSKHHDIKWAQTRIIDSESGWTKRKIKEALHIRLCENAFSHPSSQPGDTWLPPQALGAGHLAGRYESIVMIDRSCYI